MKQFWKEGKIVNDTQLSVFSGALQHGMGVFETLYWKNNHAYALEQHLDRLRKSAKAFSLSFHYSDDEIFTAISQLSEALGLKTSARLKLIVTAATTAYFEPEIPSDTLITFSEYERDNSPLSLSTQIFSPSQLSNHKSTSYASYILVKRAAKIAGQDEALLINNNGQLIECATGNFFFNQGDVWHTPSLETGCLPGIERQRVLQAMHNSGTAVKEGIYQLSDVAEYAFMTNSLAGVTSIKSIGNRKLTPLPKQALDFLSKST